MSTYEKLSVFKCFNFKSILLEHLFHEIHVYTISMLLYGGRIIGQTVIQSQTKTEKNNTTTIAITIVFTHVLNNVYFKHLYSVQTTRRTNLLTIL